MVQALVFKINALQTVDFDGCLAIILPVTNDDWKFECDIKKPIVCNKCLFNEWMAQFSSPIVCISNFLLVK